jgi:hypothetical protein
MRPALSKNAVAQRMEWMLTRVAYPSQDMVHGAQIRKWIMDPLTTSHISTVDLFDFFFCRSLPSKSARIEFLKTARKFIIVI